MPSPASELALEGPGGRLHAERWGSPAAPLVVGVPGLTGTVTSFAPLGEQLGGDELQLVALDLRGRGRSETTGPGTYGWENHARDVLGVADELGFDRFAVVGLSMGGSVAMKVAALAAERLTAVVLVDVAGRVDPGVAAPIATALARLDRAYESVDHYLDEVRSQGLVEVWDEHWDRVHRADVHDVGGRTVPRTSAAAVAEDRAYPATQDPYDRWRHLTMPTLLLRATRELRPGAGFVVPAADRDRFRGEVPHAEVVEVDADHLTITVHPDTVAAVRTFLAPAATPDQEQLVGGITHPGQVVRVGPHVRRPASPHSGSIHAYLRAVRAAGFTGVPDPVGLDGDGRERLGFVPGEVPRAPYPDWVGSDAALASVARLLRGLHDAARGFDPHRHTWSDELADPAGGTLVGHNDVEPTNVVFRDGVAVALIDFEFAAPGRPVYDLAHLARLWVPIEADVDRERLGWGPADRPARLRLVADAYGLDREGRAALLPALDDAIDRLAAAVQARVAAGDPHAVERWERTGGRERYDRRRRWWDDHREGFATALR